MVHGLAMGIGFYWLGTKPETFLLFGVSAVVILFNTGGAILRHSGYVSYGVLEKVLISPFQHQIHHSLNGQRTNFGSVLSIWDRMLDSAQTSVGKSQDQYPLPKSGENLLRQLTGRTSLRLK